MFEQIKTVQLTMHFFLVFYLPYSSVVHSYVEQFSSLLTCTTHTGIDKTDIHQYKDTKKYETLLYSIYIAYDTEIHQMSTVTSDSNAHSTKL